MCLNHPETIPSPPPAVETSAFMKLVPGAQKVGDRWPRRLPQTFLVEMGHMAAKDGFKIPSLVSKAFLLDITRHGSELSKIQSVREPDVENPWLLRAGLS